MILPVSNSFKNSKTACSSHLHPNDSANLYSNPGNVEKKSSHASYPFLDYPFLMHGKSVWINSHLESRLSDINIEWIWDGRTRNLYLGSSVGPPSPVDSISERTRSTSYSERRPSSSQFQELSFNRPSTFKRPSFLSMWKCNLLDFTVSQVRSLSKDRPFSESETRKSNFQFPSILSIAYAA